MAYAPKAGDLIWVDFDPRVGREQSGRRPALVVSPADFCRVTEFAIVCVHGYTGRADAFNALARHLQDRFHVDQRANHRTRLKPVGDLHRTGGLGEPLGERVIDGVLHQDVVGAHAGLD